MREAAAWTGFLAIVLGAVAWIDIRRQAIPDLLSLALALGGLAFAYRQGGDLTAVFYSATAAVVTGVVFLGVRFLYRRQRGLQGLGLGDVKLVTAAALWVGPFGISWMVLAACASALLTVLAMVLLRVPFDRTTRLPFGPHIAVGLVAVLIVQAIQ